MFAALCMSGVCTANLLSGLALGVLTYGDFSVLKCPNVLVRVVRLVELLADGCWHTHRTVEPETHKDDRDCGKSQLVVLGAQKSVTEEHHSDRENHE